MSDKLTGKQEAFSLAFIETGNAAEAYRRAYDVAPDANDSWIYVEACQLLDHPKIAIRIAELNAQAASLSIYTRNAALEELEEARILAHKEGQAGAAVSSVSAKMKLFGLERAKKLEVTGKNGGPVEVEPTIDLTKVPTEILEALRNAGRPAGED